ncbi:MAG TPA: hypothetical protein PLK14_12600 [Sediminibacterium sp.]|nr:hypothetical protein [Sediminibacterium sp.]
MDKLPEFGLVELGDGLVVKSVLLVLKFPLKNLDDDLDEVPVWLELDPKENSLYNQ